MLNISRSHIKILAFYRNFIVKLSIIGISGESEFFNDFLVMSKALICINIDKIL